MQGLQRLSIKIQHVPWHHKSFMILIEFFIDWKTEKIMFFPIAWRLYFGATIKTLTPLLKILFNVPININGITQSLGFMEIVFLCKLKFLKFITCLSFLNVKCV